MAVKSITPKRWLAVLAAILFLHSLAACSGGSGSTKSLDQSSLDPQPGVIYYIDDHLGNSNLLTDSQGNVLREESRYPFGIERGSKGEAATGDYAYTGKEYDAETGLVYFGGRYYSPTLARWITPDPLYLERDPRKLAESPRDMNLYGFVRNNPLRFIDMEGFRPGDLFKTPELAAIDAIRYINPTSIKENREYGGWIRKKWGGEFTYREPIKGTINRIPDFPGKPWRGAAWYHTHAAAMPGYDNEHFSPEDKEISDGSKKTGYLGTPSGSIKAYDPDTQSVSIMEKGTNHVEAPEVRISTIPYRAAEYFTPVPGNNPSKGTSSSNSLLDYQPDSNS